MLDKIINIGEGLIHHGKQNNRVYVMKTPKVNHNKFIESIEELANDKDYEKIIAKVPEGIVDEFLDSGYNEEAQVPNFYKGKEACSFVSKYMSPGRRRVKNKSTIEGVLKVARKNKSDLCKVRLEEGFECRKAEEEDVLEMAELYRNVFLSYPFPIHQEEYILSTMKENVVYFGVWDKSKLVALSSSEVDWRSQNVEMTDFAVDPEYRGKNISSKLLQSMEEEMKSTGILTAYTIARAVSYGMNCTFSKNGYDYGGTLYNNTHIAKGIESMNVWYKEL